MEYAKKIELGKTHMTERTLSTLDHQISDILNSDMHDDEKSKHYITLLKRHRMYSAPPSLPEDPVGELLNLIQPNMRIKARRIIEHIKPQVSWTKDGQLIDGDNVIDHTHIAELVEDVLKKKSDVDPLGW